MKRTFLFLTLVSICHLAFAQSNNIVRTTKEQTVVKYDENNSHTIVNGVKTSHNIMSFFKPNEIISRRVHSENVSMHVLVIGIEVKDNNHPVAKYFEHKAKLSISGRFYEHNVIPDINPTRIAALVFHAAEDQTKSYLEVKLHDKAPGSSQTHKFSTGVDRIKYYDVDGKVMETNSIAHLGLRKGTYTSQILCCKEAYEKYNDLKYIEGIEVIRTK